MFHLFMTYFSVLIKEKKKRLTLVSSVKPLPFAPKWPTWMSRSDLGRVRVERGGLRGSWRSDSKELAFEAVRESENTTNRSKRVTTILHK